MKKRNDVKAVLSTLVLLILICSSVQAICASTITGVTNASDVRGWYWKPSFPNYAPAGVPDFSQKQDSWKKITPGPNGIIDSTVAGDDVYNIDENCIAPGPDCYLNSTASGDDVEEWVFCGPVAVANCLWWFDSKYSNPVGTPGDGEDQFPLVQDYGAGDDHATANVPLLVENLARAMNTTEKGTTHVSDMQQAIHTWLNDTNLSDKFTEQTYDRPNYTATAGQIAQGQNVILLLGSYDYFHGNLTVDQSQPSGPYTDRLQTAPWWDFQSFIPAASRLDKIDLFLVSNNYIPCDVQINVYDTLYGSALGSAVFNPGYLASPTWVQFNIHPSIPLTPGSTYYLDVLQLDNDSHYEWMYDTPNPYPPGQGWMNNVPVDPYGHVFDWAFKTEYFYPTPGSVRQEGHYVTCAGVNLQDSKIAFSDPTVDIANATQSDHNDAQNISHDIYTIQTGSPKPDIDCQWWLPGYQSGYEFTVVEQSIVIIPPPDTTKPSVQIAKPINALYLVNQEWIPLSVPVIIGKIDINVTASDTDSGVNRVEFYIDEQLKMNDTAAPYNYLWNNRSFFLYTIKVVAYDNAGNSNSAELTVWKFF